MTDTLGNRMKRYEKAFEYHLPRRLPVIVRVDGRAFHTFTRSLKKPFDREFKETMLSTAAWMCAQMGGAKFAYTQSDEISILLTNDDTLSTDAWMDNDLQKLASLGASMATVAFNHALLTTNPKLLDKRPHFDGRAFVLPPEEVCNYFIWRQKDWERNSLSMFARAFYSQKELQGKKREQVHDMLHKKGENWNDLPVSYRRGTCVHRGEEGWIIDSEPPIFTQDRNYINRLLTKEE